MRSAAALASPFRERSYGWGVSHSTLPSRRSTWRASLLLASVAAALLALFAWRASLPARAIDDLPEAERRALYHRTLESLDTVCRSHPASLEDFCRDQAELAVRFRECDPACHALAEPHLPHSSR